MKRMKKMMALVIAMVMVVAMGVPVLAAKTVNVGTGAGSITLDNGTTGETYQLYKVFDATYSNDTTTTPVTQNVSYTFTKTTDNAGFYDLLVGSESPFKLTETATANVYQVEKKNTSVTDEAILSWVETNVKGKDYLKVGDEITLAEADNQKIVWTNLAYGYYMITSTLDDYEDGKSYVTIDSNLPDVTVIDKNQAPEFDKKIILTEDDPATTDVDETELAELNATGIKIDVPFIINLKGKNYEGPDKIFKYVVYDELDPGFTLKAAPVVKIGGTEKTAGADYTITYYTAKPDPTDPADTAEETTDITKAQYFEIVVKWTNDGTVNGTHLYPANTELDVRYTAFLDPAKYENIQFGANPNLNKADVKYFKGPDTDTPTGDLPDKTTETFSTSLTIKKTDGDSKPLAGAQFELTSENGTKYIIITGQKHVEDENGTYYKLTDGKFTEEAPNGNATHDAAYEQPIKKYKLVDFTEVVGDDQGSVDLKAYVKADGTLTFKGLFAGKYKLVETIVPPGFNRADDIEFTISFDSTTKKFASNNRKIQLDATNNVFDTTVVNNKGIELPSTGGIGTTIFYVIGAILVLGAGILLVTRRRMNAN